MDDHIRNNVSNIGGCLRRIEGYIKIIDAACEAFTEKTQWSGLNEKLVNPTNGRIRMDAGGEGHYGASRSKRINGKKAFYRHKGLDITCDPGQEVCCPISGRIKRAVRVYTDTPDYTGAIIEGERMTVRLLYFSLAEKPGAAVLAGQVIGKAQDISKRYQGQGVTPHVHLQIDLMDPLTVMEVKK